MSSFRSYIFQDWETNAGDKKAQFVTLLFRLAQTFNGSPRTLRKVVHFVYRLIVDWIMGIELPPTTSVGAALRIHHGHCLVVNSGSVLGAGIQLRHGVTIGSTSEDGGSPVLGDGVDVGAGAILLGEIVIGSGAIVGAGAVVLADVPSGGTVVGNPARLIHVRGDGGAAS